MNPLKIVIIVAVIVLLFILIKYIKNDPYNLTSVLDATVMTKIKAEDLATTGSDVPSSNFAYSVWFYVKDWNYKYGKPKVIFGRMGQTSGGGGDGTVDDLTKLDPCPAVVLSPQQNNINIMLGCYPGVNDQPTTSGGTTVVHTCSIGNIPIQKWVNLTMSVYGRTMDLYVDGKLVRTCLLPGVANVNNKSSVFLTPLGGFSGWTSKFKYFPNAVSPQNAWDIYTAGYDTWLGNIFGAYEIEISVLENGVETSSVTI